MPARDRRPSTARRAAAGRRPAPAADPPTLLRSVWLGEDRGRPALLVDGVVQSVAPDYAGDGYWAAMLPAHRPRRALLLGLGAGTVAHLLVRRFGPLPVVGVDDDPAVVALARGAFGPLPAGLQIVLADARRFVQGCAGRFDYVAVDLFHGHDVPAGVFGQPFLRAVQAALTPAGTAVFNLFRDRHEERRLARLGRVMRVERVARVRQNLLVHCRR
jgi:spermidine synthase